MQAAIAEAAREERVGLFPRFALMRRSIDAGSLGRARPWTGCNSPATTASAARSPAPSTPAAADAPMAKEANAALLPAIVVTGASSGIGQAIARRGAGGNPSCCSWAARSACSAISPPSLSPQARRRPRSRSTCAPGALDAIEHALAAHGRYCDVPSTAPASACSGRRRRPAAASNWAS
jgi:hypothetical protein